MSLQDGCPKTALLVGAGNRGHIYATYATHYSDQLKIVGVCEPRDYQRQEEQRLHNIPPEHVFRDWRDAAAIDKFADSVLICTLADQHKGPAIAFAKKGYHILLEKPIAMTEEDCKEIVKACKESDVILCVCHVLRYTTWVKSVKDIIQRGDIGDVVNINHTHPNGYLSFTHYSVRGYSQSRSISAMLGACCHDFDLIRFWFSGRKCLKISSFGNASHFSAKHKPSGAASRCLDCPSYIEEGCPYSAKKIYLEPVKAGTDIRWLTSQLADVVDVENIEDALRTGPYGRCVYDLDNDMTSHQVVNMEFEGGVTATLQWVAFSGKLATREVKIYGTKGEITVKDGNPPKIKVYDFNQKITRRYSLELEDIPAPLDGYSGANFYMIKAFVDALHNPEIAESTTGEDALESHLLAFAADRARMENRVVNMTDS